MGLQQYNGWAPVPRLVGPAILMAGVLALFPTLQIPNPIRIRNLGRAMSGVFGVVLSSAGFTLNNAGSSRPIPQLEISAIYDDSENAPHRAREFCHAL